MTDPTTDAPADAPQYRLTRLNECGTPAGPSVPITAEEAADIQAVVEAFPTATLALRCAAAAIPAPGDNTECDGRHDTVVVRPRFSARLRHNVLDTVTGCVHHGARLLVVGNGGSVAPGPGGTEADAAAVRTRAEAAWGILAAPAPASDHDLSDAFDPAAADTVHYVDPRVRRLAQAAWRRKTGGTYRQWLMLGKNHPDALIAEAREWMRAAVAAGLLPPPTTD
ncbi:hypothetical protein [Streptomyces sp. NBC_01207]|uniref:hypothetical protein n=1 Tax=Streptomyces sp. NBC_01207 TaxID=2903772 RepID=UPI002E12F234|nr:hypothetical protein OG457_27325 [Streptomyces sp. NBC_01207]